MEEMTIIQQNGIVTGRDVFLENIPLITESIMVTREMTSGQYEEFKKECMAETGKKYPLASGFMQNIMLVVDAFFQSGYMEPAGIQDGLKDMHKIA